LHQSLQVLRQLGQSAWLDFLSREMILDGSLQELIDQGLGGVTANPTIFEKAFSKGQAYDESIRELGGAGMAPLRMYEVMAEADVRAAADLLRPLYDRTGGADGFVSLEVSPRLAFDTAGTLDEARRLWAELSRPNVLIKVPGTAEGLPAIQRLTAEGINVNVTLLFGVPRYEGVLEAYVSGLEERARAGADLGHVSSVASFFLSRIDTLVDSQLAEDAAGLRGQAAIASAQLAYDRWLASVGSPRFRSLVEKGARVQRLLWASTGTKNPAYSDVKYVDPLIGADTVNTLPVDTLNALMDHGRIARTLPVDSQVPRQRLAALADAGIDIDAVTQQLEDEGVRKFEISFESLLSGISQKLLVMSH
jgi:transaldolase